MGIFTRSNGPGTCWLTEQEACQLLDQVLSEAPGRDNLVEDYPYYASDGWEKMACPSTT